MSELGDSPDYIQHSIQEKNLSAIRSARPYQLMRQPQLCELMALMINGILNAHFRSKEDTRKVKLIIQGK